MISADNDDEENDPAVESHYDKEANFFDKSFKTKYVGYADGIDLNALDSTTNWQFDKKYYS